MTKRINILILLTICFVFILGIPVVSASQTAQLYFEEAQAKRGRLFDVNFCADKTENLAAFTADISYDAAMIAYRDCDVADSSMKVQVNASEAGLLRVVFLCEEGVDCSNATTLMTFSFKALQAGNSVVSASASDLINSDSEDLDCTVKSGLIVIDSPPAGSKNPANETGDDNAENESSAEVDSGSYTNGITSAEPVDNSIVMIVIVVGALLLAIFVCVIFRIIAVYKSKANEVENKNKKSDCYFCDGSEDSDNEPEEATEDEE